MMKIYESLEIQLIAIAQEDVITASLDAETNMKDDIFGPN